MPTSARWEPTSLPQGIAFWSCLLRGAMWASPPTTQIERLLRCIDRAAPGSLRGRSPSVFRKSPEKTFFERFSLAFSFFCKAFSFLDAQERKCVRTGWQVSARIKMAPGPRPGSWSKPTASARAGLQCIRALCRSIRRSGLRLPPQAVPYALQTHPPASNRRPRRSPESWACRRWALR